MRIAILWACLTAIPVGAMSQTNSQFNKGYYSIGNKYRIMIDLDHANLIRERYVPDPYSQSPKGYYSPEIKRRQLPWRKVRGERRDFPVPVITKGYYSIGRNAEQLRK